MLNYFRSAKTHYENISNSCEENLYTHTCMHTYILNLYLNLGSSYFCKFSLLEISKKF